VLVDPPHTSSACIDLTGTRQLWSRSWKCQRRPAPAPAAKSRAGFVVAVREVQLQQVTLDEQLLMSQSLQEALEE
jgi:hypothetical protein